MRRGREAEVGPNLALLRRTDRLALPARMGQKLRLYRRKISNRNDKQELCLTMTTLSCYTQIMTLMAWYTDSGSTEYTSFPRLSHITSAKCDLELEVSLWLLFAYHCTACMIWPCSDLEQRPVPEKGTTGNANFSLKRHARVRAVK